MSSKELESLISKLTLQNALSYNGKPLAKTIIGGILGSHPEFRPQAKLIKDLVEMKCSEVSNMSMDQITELVSSSFPDLLDQHTSNHQKEQKSLPKLPNAIKGQVKLRLAPEPSGYLHIGHAYAFFVNYLYKLEYDGKLTLRLEDTNPKKALLEFYDAAIDTFNYLGIKYDDIIYESDHIGMYQEKAKSLIEKNKAYACTCSVEETQKNRLEKKACIHRSNSIEDNLEHWDKMFDSYDEGDAVIRLIGDMTTTQEALRDPTIMRIVDHPHPRIGTKHRVYPLYDYSVSIEDSHVTHVLRSEEFVPKVALQNLVRSYLDLPNPEFVHFSRLKIKNTPVQKRVIRSLIDNKIIESWNDPRLSTVIGLRSRGIVPDTLKEIVYELRLSTSKGEMDWNIILALNRKILDPKVRRFFAVTEPIKLTIEDIEPRKIELPNHPSNKSFGTRILETNNTFWVSGSDLVDIKSHETIRLKEFQNIDIVKATKKGIVGKVSKNASHDIPKIQWVPEQDGVPLELRTINDLYESVEENKLNPQSMVISNGFIEKNILELNQYDVMQLERIGFACLQEKDKKVILNLT